MSYYNAVAFCVKLTRQENAAGNLPRGWHYALPTEAQWEYACRAGSSTRFHFGDDESLIDRFAWGRSTTRNDEPYAHPVGAKRPNARGLHDMHGNVLEWCRDGWSKKLPGGNDPLVPAKGDLRIVRGGSWLMPDIFSQSTMRDEKRAVDQFHSDVGFHVALCEMGED